MIQTIRLDNGATLLLEPIDGIRSAAVGLWLGVGARHERAAQCGISHCLEHMVFKGTSRRSAVDIARETDAIGGQFNAYTTKECTAYYARVLDSHLSEALDILTDMVFEATCSDDDLALERNVIAEEIGMYEDTPEDLVGERLYEVIYPNQALGRAILGTPETLETLDGAALRVFRDEYYRPKQMIAALAGRFSDADVTLLTQRLAALPAGKAVPNERAVYSPAFTAIDKQLEQNHVCLALPALRVGDASRYAMQLLCGIVGGGASSRLFQLLREEKGLCYAVHSYTVAHVDTGLFCVYTALGRENEPMALRLMGEVLVALAHDGPSQSELDRQREQVKANVLMSLESASARVSHAARSMQALGHIPSPDELIAAFDAVTAAQVRELAAGILREPSFSAVGRVREVGEYQALVTAALG